MRREVSLSAERWLVKGYWPWGPFMGDGPGRSDPPGVTEWIEARVPGGVHHDLFRAGLIEHPYVDVASARCEWVENRWWVYKTTFVAPELAGDRCDLVFDGIDHHAWVYLDGVQVGEHEGMLVPASFDVRGKLRPGEPATLVVVVTHPPDEIGQVARTSLTRTQKSRFNYKWDFSTRLVSVGLWGDVRLVASPAPARPARSRVSLAPNPGAPADARPYTFVVDGEPIFVRGVNLVPLDHLPGTVSAEHERWMIDLMRHAHVNLVRLWGGGVIGTSRFYELCDDHGILVWQDFIQSSSLLENVPATDPAFLAELRAVSAHAIEARRHHPSLAVWCGGNELSDATNVPSREDDPNIALLAGLVRELDPARPFLPTTGSGPRGLASDVEPGHDVHGDWYYLGNPRHYAFYEAAEYLFHSEFGAPGAAGARCLRRCLSPAHRTPRSKRASAVWRHHGEWWDSVPRDEELFGAFGDDLDGWSRASQWIQAEAVRSVVERDRRRAPHVSGCIVWQLNEPWPNVACTSLVDHDGDPKMALGWLARAYRPVHASLRYERLDWPLGSRFAATVWAHADETPPPETDVVATVIGVRGELLHAFAPGAIRERGPHSLGEIAFDVEARHGPLFVVRLVQSGLEHAYVFSTQAPGAGPLFAAARSLRAELAVEAAGGWRAVARSPDRARTFSIRNEGPELALFVHPVDRSGASWLWCDDAWLPLAPGETRTLEVLARPRAGGGFLEDDRPADPGAEPDIAFVHLTS